MAGYKYFTVLTDVGKQKLAEAIANETALDFTEMAVGDSNGTSYEPTSDMTALKHVTYRAAIGSMKINAEDKNIMEFEFVVPASTGGFYVREAGLYSSDGTLIAISRLPEQYKADMAEGAGSSMTVRILVAISSDAQIYITVPASITYATKTYVTEEFKKHKADSNPHVQYVLNEIYSAKIDELQEDINSKAANNHSHDFSSITGSMDFADNRLKGLLPISRGGTNSQDGFGWKNAYLDTEFNAKIGLRYPFNTQQLAAAIIKLHQPIFCMVYGWRKGENVITDFPGSNLTHRTIINMSDLNQFYLETIAPFNLTTYICNVSGGIAGPWIKTRNYDGSIPAEIISPTILKYENSDGVWTETKLTTGEVMLEGFGSFSIQTEPKKINIPKNINTSKGSSVQVTGSLNSYVTGIINYYPNHYITIINNNNSRNSCSWYFRGILA